MKSLFYRALSLALSLSFNGVYAAIDALHALNIRIARRHYAATRGLARADLRAINKRLRLP